MDAPTVGRPARATGPLALPHPGPSERRLVRTGPRTGPAAKVASVRAPGPPGPVRAVPRTGPASVSGKAESP
jgi:hypothetical protein